MSYGEKDLSTQDALPILLFEIVQGSNTWRLTSAPVVITGRLSETWAPAVIVPDEIGQSGDLAKDPIRLQLPLSHSLSQSFLLDPPDVVTTVTVYRTHYDDDETLVYWKGRVLDTSITGGVMAFDCESIFSRLRRIGAAPVWSKTCRHVLFGQGCRLQASAFAEAMTVTGLAGNGIILTIPDAESHADMVGGTIMAPDGTMRMVVKHSGATVTLMRRIRSLVVALAADPGGFSVTYYPGCDKSFRTCKETYGNDANFGGWPAMPELNPMAGNNVY